MEYKSTPVRLIKARDGQSQYFHVKYSDDGETFTENNGDTLGAWIGTMVSTDPNPSLNFDDYTWKKFTEDVDDELAGIQQVIVEQYTDLVQESQKIALSAVEGYTRKTEFEEFKEYATGELELNSKRLNLKFSETTEQINTVSGNLQDQIDYIEEYFEFDVRGLTIGQADSPFKVTLSHEMLQFLINNNVSLQLDPDGNSIIPILKVTQSKDEFGYVTMKDSNGRIVESFVGEEE